MTMVWQRIVDHRTYGAGGTIVVESKDGNRYPVTTPHFRDNELVYSHMMNERNDWDLWADVNHAGDEPTTDHISTGHPEGGPPDK